MTRMGFQAATTMRELQKKLDVIGHNVSNANTTGYKTRHAQFSSLLFQDINNFSDEEANSLGRLTPQGIRQGSGAKVGQSQMDLTAGVIQSTGRLLDIALPGDNHLLAVEVNDNGTTETQYTRDGALYLNPDIDGNLMLVTSNGQPLLDPAGNPIVIADDPEGIAMNASGQLVVTRNGLDAVEGELAIFQAVRPQFLEASGQNLLRLPDITEEDFVMGDIINAVPDFEREVISGSLEQSNVDLSTQMSELINMQRAYQFNARTISMHDQMRGLVNQLR